MLMVLIDLLYRNGLCQESSPLHARARGSRRHSHALPSAPVPCPFSDLVGANEWPPSPWSGPAQPSSASSYVPTYRPIVQFLPPPPPSCADAEFCGCVGRCARQTPLQGGESGTCRIDTLNLSITPRKFQFCYGFMTLYLVTVCSSNYCKTPFSSSAFASDQPNFQTNLSHVILSYETPMMPKLYIFSNKFTTCVLIHFVCVYVWSSVFFL